MSSRSNHQAQEQSSVIHTFIFHPYILIYISSIHFNLYFVHTFKIYMLYLFVHYIYAKSVLSTEQSWAAANLSPRTNHKQQHQSWAAGAIIKRSTNHQQQEQSVASSSSNQSPAAEHAAAAAEPISFSWTMQQHFSITPCSSNLPANT